MKKLLHEIADYYGVSIDEIRGKSRESYLVCARFMFCYLALKKHSSPRVGMFINRDHSTVLSARDRFQDYLERDEVLQEEIQTILDRVENNTILFQYTQNEKPYIFDLFNMEYV